MPKSGILHDYDLHANAEPSAQSQKCMVCDAEPMAFQWSDYHGEGMCTRCGTPYQLRAGSDEMVKEGAYPYLNLKPEWVAVVRRYYEETKCFTYLGSMVGGTPPGMPEFCKWVKQNNAAPVVG